MATTPLFTGEMTEDWKNFSNYWAQSNQVLGAEVGPTWKMPDEHLACIRFAETYPDSKQFLLDRLSDSHPVVAAYAFKCLIRITDLKRCDVPQSALSRMERVETVFHSSVERKTLGDFMEEYFQKYANRGELLEEQQRSLDWQKNELAEYERAKAQEKQLGD
ncbi:MAG: hypothetical protein K8T25_10550 [Planctomycetia bacterium]|nr:hypothetical protein [Planctomycetia bacterium]